MKSTSDDNLSGEERARHIEYLDFLAEQLPADVPVWVVVEQARDHGNPQPLLDERRRTDVLFDEARSLWELLEAKRERGEHVDSAEWHKRFMRVAILQSRQGDLDSALESWVRTGPGETDWAW